jgi:hypothetical protein
MSEVRLHLPARRLATWVVVLGCACAGGLLLLDRLDRPASRIEDDELRALIDLGAERSLAAWLVGTETLMLALTLWCLAFAARRRRWGFTLLASLVSAVAVYEGALLHKRLVDVAQGVRGGVVTMGAALDWLARRAAPLPGHRWQVVVAVPLAALAVWGFAFLWRELGRPAERGALVAAALALALSIGPQPVPQDARVLAGMLGRTLVAFALLRLLPRAVGELHLRARR